MFRGMLRLSTLWPAYVLAGCATLQGVPQGLTLQDVKDMSLSVTSGPTPRASLSSVLDKGDVLYEQYRKANGDYQKFAFWSGAAYIPLAAIASWAVYAKASHDVLAGTGILAGGVAGSALLVNGKTNTPIYTAAMTAVNCIEINLRGLSTSAIEQKSTDLTTSIDTLAGYISADQSILDASNVPEKFDDQAAKTELKSNPQLVLQYSAAQKKLSDAIDTATKARDSAEAERAAYSSLPMLAAISFLQIDNAVQSKVAPGAVDYASLVKSFSAAISAASSGNSQSVTAPTGRVPLARVEKRIGGGTAKEPRPTPIQDAITGMTSSAVLLAKQTGVVTAESKAVGAVAAQSAMQSCIKK